MQLVPHDEAEAHRKALHEMGAELQAREEGWQAQQQAWKAHEQQLLTELRRLSEAEAAAREELRNLSIQKHPSVSHPAAWATVLGLESDGEDEDGVASKPSLEGLEPSLEGLDGDLSDGCRQLSRRSLRTTGGIDVAVQVAEVSGCTGRAPEGGGGHHDALLEAAREEIQRLKDINLRLIESRGVGERCGGTRGGVKRCVGGGICR